MRNLDSGLRIGNYTLLDQIGRTGMSEVWRASDLEGKIVALKTISRQAGEDPQLRARFLREGGEHQKLKHPSIVSILDFFEEDGGFFLVMQYLSDGSLEDKLERNNWGPLPIPQALRIAGQILPALDYAHQKLIIHRDVKPSNILLEGERAFLSDFGIALALGRRRLTTFSQILGTRCYMSPEQILTPLEITHLTDVYSFGCVLYELLTGRQPFGQDDESAEGQFAIMEQRVHQPPVPPREWNTEIPPRLERIVLTSLAADPQNRFAGCGSFALALSAVEREMTGIKVIVPLAPERPKEPIPEPKPTLTPVLVTPVSRAQPLAAPLSSADKEEPVSVVGNVIAATIAGLLCVPFLAQNVPGWVFVSVAASNLLFLRVLYKAWRALPSKERRITPGEAVAKLFIPFYNLYWIWKAVPGFAAHYNQYLRKHRLPHRPQPFGFYIFFCLFYWYLPILAFLFAPVDLAEILELFDVIVLAPVAIGVMARAIHLLKKQPPATAATKAEPSTR